MSTHREAQTLVHVARRYYLSGRSQQQIADELGLSRSNVSRMLSAALDRGIVEIKIHDPSGRDRDLEHDLQDAFGLRDARVAVWADTTDRADPLTRVGPLAAELLLETAVDGARVALSWGRALQAMVRATTTKRQHPVELVQLVGGLASIDDEISGQELVRELANRLGATGCHYLHAPAVLSSPQARDALLTESSVAATLDAARQADVAFVGIGSPTHGSSARVLETVSGHRDAALSAFWDQQPVGDVALRYFDLHGRPLGGRVDQQVIGVDIGELKRVPTVVGVASGQAKVQAVIGALHGQIIDVLVCDDGLARSVLEAVARTERRPDQYSPKTRVIRGYRSGACFCLSGARPRDA